MNSTYLIGAGAVKQERTYHRPNDIGQTVPQGRVNTPSYFGPWGGFHPQIMRSKRRHTNMYEGPGHRIR